MAGIHRETHYWWLKHDPAYAVAFAQAEEKAADALEAEARRRAINGVLRYKFDKGRPITNPETGEPYYELEYSDTLLIFLLKGARPGRYRERIEIEHSLVRQEAERIAAEHGLDATELIRQAEALVKGTK